MKLSKNYRKLKLMRNGSSFASPESGHYEVERTSILLPITLADEYNYHWGDNYEWRIVEEPANELMKEHLGCEQPTTDRELIEMIKNDVIASEKIVKSDEVKYKPFTHCNFDLFDKVIKSKDNKQIGRISIDATNEQYPYRINKKSLSNIDLYHYWTFEDGSVIGQEVINE
jgi:hypothetical protein